MAIMPDDPRYMVEETAEIYHFLLNYTDELINDKDLNSFFDFDDAPGFKNKQPHFPEQEYLALLDTHDKLLKHGIQFINNIYDSYKLRPELAKLYQLHIQREVPETLAEMIAHTVRKNSTVEYKVQDLCLFFAERLNHKGNLTLNKFTPETVDCIVKEKCIQTLDDEIVLEQFLQEQKSRKITADTYPAPIE
jgi:hypothetical protein